MQGEAQGGEGCGCMDSSLADVPCHMRRFSTIRAIDAHLIASAWFGLAMHLGMAVTSPSTLHLLLHAGYSLLAQGTALAEVLG